MRAKSRRLQQVDLVIVDYLQLMLPGVRRLHIGQYQRFDGGRGAEPVLTPVFL
jgi:hypothetical protein